jgi:hypothetical protein
MCHLALILIAPALACGILATISWYAVANRLFRDGYPANLIRNSQAKTLRMLKTYSEVAPSKHWPLRPARAFMPLLVAMSVLSTSAFALSRYCPF